MSSLKAVAAALVLMLVLVPSVTRAVQVLQIATSSTQTSGFHKSIDTPPARPVIAPDRTAHGFDPQPTTPNRHEWTPAADDVLPTDPFVPNGGALRAPPASRS